MVEITSSYLIDLVQRLQYPHVSGGGGWDLKDKNCGVINTADQYGQFSERKLKRDKKLY